MSYCPMHGYEIYYDDRDVQRCGRCRKPVLDDASQLNDAHELKLIAALNDWYTIDDRTVERLDPVENASIASVRATLTMRANQLRERVPEDLQP